MRKLTAPQAPDRLSSNQPLRGHCQVKDRPPEDPEATRGAIVGRLFVSEMQPATMIEIVRLNEHNDFKAIFTGILSADAQEITGHVVNSRGNLGSIMMQKV